MATVVFDFDGTLANTFPLFAKTAYKLTYVRPKSPEEVHRIGRLPLISAMFSLGIPRWRVLLMSLIFRKYILSHMAEAQSVEGVEEMLQKLTQRGHKVIVLTSNARKNVEAFLAIHNLAQYISSVETVFYGSAWFKRRGLRRIMRRKGLSSGEVWQVGNEPLDMEAARAVGVRAVGVTWAGQARDSLVQAGADFIIDSPDELLPIVGANKV